MNTISKCPRRRHGVCRLASLVLVTWFGLASAAQAQADLVLFNGKVITVDSGDGIAQAVAVRDGKIIAVGSNEQINRLATATTQRFDLRGRTVTPGLLDAHAHF